MRKRVLAIILTLFCSYIYAAERENIVVDLGFPRDIESGEKGLFSLRIKNFESVTLHDLELSVSSDDILEITLDKIKIDSITPNETITVNMEIINNQRYYFSKDTFVTLKISNNEFTKDTRFRFTLKPVKNFWFSIIMSIALIAAVLFIVIFIKINKGEENAG
jgi:uncharacterized membrane protein